MSRQFDRSARREIERWFLRRGLPQFIADYSGSGEFLARALPVLILIFVGEVLLAVNIEWGIGANVLAVIAGLVGLAGVWVAGNLIRRRRPFERPERIGPVELAIFVLGPAMLPIIFGFQWRQAIIAGLANLFLVGAVYSAASFAVIPMTRWALGRVARQVGATFRMVARALPLLLVFVIFLLMTNEVWQMSVSLDGPRMILVLGFFFAVGTIFLLARIPSEASDMSRFDNWDTVRSYARGTPAEPFALELSGDGNAQAAGVRAGEFDRRQWLNVGLVLLFSEGLQILTVSLVLGVFYVVFGMFAINVDLQSSWAGVEVHALVDIVIWGRQVALTDALLKVAAFLTAFSGLYFTVVVLTDTTYRDEFLVDIVDEMRQAFAVRLIYLAELLGGNEAGSA